MKRKWLILIFSVLILFSFLIAEHWVEGYYRDDGTYVNGYWRTDPDNTVTNNYSYPGNYNPNDGPNINSDYDYSNYKVKSSKEWLNEFKNDYNINTDYDFNNTSEINSTSYARVVRVIDGDTVVVRTISGKKKTIRIKGIDAPEKSQRYGNRAKRKLKRLLSGGLVRIKIDEKGKYGRSIGKIYSNGFDVGKEMIKTGNARQYKYSNNETYEASENRAENLNIGVWSFDSVDPYEYRNE